MRPYALRPPVFGFGFVSDFSGLSRVTSEKSDDDWNRRPGLVGLRLRMGIGQLPKTSMRSPSRSDTSARFSFERELHCPLRRLRLRLPLRLIVFTFVTCTLKICSTALRISILLASGATTNV